MILLSLLFIYFFLFHFILFFFLGGGRDVFFYFWNEAISVLIFSFLFCWFFFFFFFFLLSKLFLFIYFFIFLRMGKGEGELVLLKRIIMNFLSFFVVVNVFRFFTVYQEVVFLFCKNQWRITNDQHSKDDEIWKFWQERANLSKTIKPKFKSENFRLGFNWFYWVCSWEIMENATSLTLPSTNLSGIQLVIKSFTPKDQEMYITTINSAISIVVIMTSLVCDMKGNNSYMKYMIDLKVVPLYHAISVSCI